MLYDEVAYYRLVTDGSLVALVLPCGECEPWRIVGENTPAEYQKHIEQEFYGSAVELSEDDFSREMSDRQKHTSETIAMLVQAGDISHYYLYGLTNVRSPLYEQIGLIVGGVYLKTPDSEGRCHTYVALKDELEPEERIRWHLRFLSRP